MKQILLLIAITSTMLVQAQHTSAWKEIKAGSTGASAIAGDTLDFAPGNYTYFVLNGVNATKAKPVVLLFNGVSTFKNGFDVTNSKGLKFDGGDAYNLKVRGASGVAFSFKGKCGDIQLIGADVDGAYSWGWFKTEVGEPAFANWDYWTKNADGTISANYIMDGLFVKHCIFKNAAFDGWYVNSTGQQADRAMIIDGKTFYPLPPKCANIQFEDVVMDGAARTGMVATSVIVVIPLVLAAGMVAVPVLAALVRVIAFVAVVHILAGTVALDRQVTVAGFACGPGLRLGDCDQVLVVFHLSCPAGSDGRETAEIAFAPRRQPPGTLLRGNAGHARQSLDLRQLDDAEAVE